MTPRGSGRLGPRGRGRRLIAPLRAATMLAVVMAAASLAIGREAHGLATALAIGLVVVPLSRVGFLAIRWAQLGDRRFSWRAALLLVEVGLATAAALAA